MCPEAAESTEQLLAACFPFRFELDANGAMRSVSGRLQGLLPTAEGRPLLEVFSLRHCAAATTCDDLRGATGTVLVLDALSCRLRLRGQLLSIGPERLCFVGSPWFTDPDELAGTGLRLSDFAPHDPIVEYLSLLQASRAQAHRLDVLAARLARSERRFRSLWTRAFDLVFEVDGGGRFTNANQACCHTLGLAHDELLGRPLASMLTGDGDLLGREILPMVLAGRTLRGVHLRGVRPDGEIVFLEGLVAPRLLDDEVIGGDGFFRDVTRERVARSQLERLNQELEDRVVARTLELDDARERAVHASTAKNLLIATLSHEVRNSMSAVLGFADLLAIGVDGSNQHREWIEGIRRAGGHLMGLLDDALDLSRIEAGKLDIRPGPVDLERLREDLHVLLMPLAERKGLQLVVTGPARRKVVCTDGGRLRQIVLNLGSNAVKFTDTGHVEVRIRCEPERSCAGESLLLVVDVIDTGSGIAPDELTALFDQFKQGRAGNAARVGAGLGLSLSRRLAHLLGGELEVVSEVGTGSRFRLSLPVMRVDCQRPARPARCSPDANPRSRTRLLVVDDHPLSRRATVAVLSAAGFEVASCACGEEAIQQVQSGHLDGILMDLEMPGLGGLEALRRIRSADSPRPWVVMFSGSHSEWDRTRALEAGALDFLTKPVDFEHLVRVLDELAGVTL